MKTWWIHKSAGSPKSSPQPPFAGLLHRFRKNNDADSDKVGEISAQCPYAVDGIYPCTRTEAISARLATEALVYHLNRPIPAAPVRFERRRTWNFGPPTPKNRVCFEGTALESITEDEVFEDRRQLWLKVALEHCHNLAFWNSYSDEVISCAEMYELLKKLKEVAPDDPTVEFWLGFSALRTPGSAVWMQDKISPLEHMKKVLQWDPENRHSKLYYAAAHVTEMRWPPKDVQNMVHSVIDDATKENKIDVCAELIMLIIKNKLYSRDRDIKDDIEKFEYFTKKMPYNILAHAVLLNIY